MQNQRKKIMRRPKIQYDAYVQRQIDRFRRNRPSGSGRTCSDGDECPYAHLDPNQADGGGFARREFSSWKRGFGSSELIGGCLGFDGRGGWNAGKANAAGSGRANDGVSSLYGKANYSGGGSNWGGQKDGGGEGPSLGDGGSCGGGVNWVFNCKNEETNAGRGSDTNTVDDDAWGYKPKSGALSSSGSLVGNLVINGSQREGNQQKVNLKQHQKLVGPSKL